MNYKSIPIYPQGFNVVECQVLGGIDTLYFFVENNSESIELYQDLWNSVLNDTFKRKNYHFLNFSGKKSGFIGGWYSYIGLGDIPFFRIGFKDPEKQKQVKNVYVQLDGAGIYHLGIKKLLEYVKNELSDLLGYTVTNDNLHASRVDLNAFVDGFDFGQINIDLFRTYAYKPSDHTGEIIQLDIIQDGAEFRNRRATETLYIGDHRNSPCYLKIYNKRLELSKKLHDLSSSIKIQSLTEQGVYNTEHVWNIEFTIKREMLKVYQIFTITDLFERADNVFKDLMERNAFLGFDSETIENHRINKNISRLPVHEIWQKISDDYKICDYCLPVERIVKQYKKGSKDHSKLVITRELERQIKQEQEFTIMDLNHLYLESMKFKKSMNEFQGII